MVPTSRPKSIGWDGKCPIIIRAGSIWIIRSMSHINGERGFAATWDLKRKDKKASWLLNWQCLLAAAYPCRRRNVILVAVSRFAVPSRLFSIRGQSRGTVENIIQAANAFEDVTEGYIDVWNGDNCTPQSATAFYSFQINLCTRVRLSQSL